MQDIYTSNTERIQVIRNVLYVIRDAYTISMGPITKLYSITTLVIQSVYTSNMGYIYTYHGVDLIVLRDEYTSNTGRI